jgi:uroporphyrinogen decarboxylase
MIPKEIAEAVFRFEEIWPVPYWVPVWKYMRAELDTYYGTDSWRNKLVDYFAVAGVGEKRAEDLGNTRQRSVYGYVTREPIKHLEEPALSGPTLDGYTWPDPEELGDWDRAGERFAETSSSFRLCGLSFGYFERASYIRGVEDLLVDMIDHPQFVHDLMDGYLKIRLKLIDLIADRFPVDAIMAGGDDCDQRGPMMGLPRWQEFIKPRIKAEIDHAHSKGLRFVAHMCGNARPLLDDLIEIKLDALESLQPEAMDVYELKQAAQGKLVLIGGLGVQSILRFGSPDQVRAETKRLIRELGKGGGYVFGPSKPITKNFVPLENAVACLDALWEEQ